MPKIKQLRLVQTTSMKEDADTEDSFALWISGALSPWRRFTFPKLSHDARERGQTDDFGVLFDGESPNLVLWQSLTDAKIAIESLGKDAWLPQSFWVLAQNLEGDWRLVTAVERWPSDRWFSTQASDGGGKAKPAWSLDAKAPFPPLP